MKGTKKLVSAGGLVYRLKQGFVEVCLCGRGEPRQWNLPKGTPNMGESLLDTALRETSEETGLRVAAEGPVGSINYWFTDPVEQVRCDKTVHFFLMSVLGGDTRDHDHEFDQVEWFNVADARDRLAFINEVKILDKAMALFDMKTITDSSGT